MLDTHELSRRPGSQRQMSRTVPAPADLGIDVFGVPEGAPVEFDLRIESVMEGVLVSGEARADLVGDCVRCLEPITDPERRSLAVDLQELFLYPDHVTEDDDEAEVSVLRDDLVDLEPLLRDAVVLALPFQPLCTEDCPGLCVDCGALLAEDPQHSHEAPIDPRWAALVDLDPPAAS